MFTHLKSIMVANHEQRSHATLLTIYMISSLKIASSIDNISNQQRQSFHPSTAGFHLLRSQSWKTQPIQYIIIYRHQLYPMLRCFSKAEHRDFLLFEISPILFINKNKVQVVFDTKFVVDVAISWC